MGFIDTIFDWTGDNFSDGDRGIHKEKTTTGKLTDVFDVIVSTVDNGN